MEKIVEVAGKTYVVDTTPRSVYGLRLTFARMYELRVHQVSGVLASTLSEAFDEVMIKLERLYVEDDEKAAVVLKLGHKFSTSRAWKNLFDWAYFRQRNDNQGEAVL